MTIMMTKDASFISNEDLTTIVWFAVVALVFGTIVFLSQYFGIGPLTGAAEETGHGRFCKIARTL